MRVTSVKFCYIRKHPPKLVNLPSGPFLSHNDEVIICAPDDPALPTPYFLLTIEIIEYVSRGYTVHADKFNRYIITDGTDYWQFAIECTNPYLTVDVLFDPPKYDLKIFREVIQKFIMSLSD